MNGFDVASTKIQPARAIRLGNGYSHIRNGKFAPHKTITKDENCGGDPAHKVLRSCHRSDESRNRDERTDSQHIGDIQTGRLK